MNAPIHQSDLASRVAHRKQVLIAEILEHKKNSCRAGAAEAIDRIKGRLSELAHIVKDGAVGSRAAMGPRAALQLEEWIAR